MLEQQPSDDDHQVGDQLARRVDVLAGPLASLARQELRLAQMVVEIRAQQVERVGEHW
jgi:hypothetical protein